MKSLIKSLLAGAGYRIESTRYSPRQLLDPAVLRPLEFDDVICRLMYERGAALTFVQVGVFDGVTGDPLRKYIEPNSWRGVLVEPQSRAANALRDLYRDNDRIQIVQAALDSKPGERTLYTVQGETLPTWAGGLASFDRASIVKHTAYVPDLHDAIREEQVACVTFDAVLERLGGAGLDLLQIDTEGADAFILSLFPFDRLKPAVVHFEVKHLSKAQREDCLDRLLSYGYKISPSGNEDMLAILV